MLIKDVVKIIEENDSDLSVRVIWMPFCFKQLFPEYKNIFLIST